MPSVRQQWACSDNEHWSWAKGSGGDAFSGSGENALLDANEHVSCYLAHPALHVHSTLP